MSLSKQDVIDKILSFNYQQLEAWIRSRLHGDDPYFSIYEGYETNLNDFTADAYNTIKNEIFRDKFLEILNDLTTELSGFSQEKIEEEKEYIYELLTLCSSVKKFENKATLYRIARSGKLKGFKVNNIDLHLVLLTTLASYYVTGDYDFWIEQMKDDSNKYYANAAFYALLNRQYRLDILFDHIEIFIERFKGKIDLVLGIQALMEEYKSKAIVQRFKAIESKLTCEQKEAVNTAFVRVGYNKLYQIYPEPKQPVIYKPLKPASSRVGQKRVEYDKVESLLEKSAEIFIRMGFDIEMNRKIAGHSIDIFIKKKKVLINKYECYACRCWEEDRKVNKNEVIQFSNVVKAIRDDLSKQKKICASLNFLVISGKGFTKGAVKVAEAHGIELKTLDDLEADLI